MDCQVHEGARQPLRQWLFTRVSQKIASNAIDEAFEIDLRIRKYEAEKYCGLQSVIMSTSMYMVRRILSVPELWKREYHICPCENEAWEPLPPDAWFHPDGVRSAGPAYECRVCKGKRFTVQQQPSGRTIVKPQLVRVTPCLLTLCMTPRLTPPGLLAPLSQNCYYLTAKNGFLQANFNDPRITMKVSSHYASLKR
ncbi:hypothetical protein DUNSADRAFT_7764 [Dunaliella salina]|uniref:Uncharacterized protein n=1 Tax=Dunaliella salina TaxID=3046 RepID=A0ABQ7FT51_DUNSA|nr:hypothetical protein DUNSADRAFT_7764 [Dunaliella salina]|eukprot:KAF5825666.1 hypothetical protein DUNSADRAFT_7764 [Dunaliella salina]